MRGCGGQFGKKWWKYALVAHDGSKTYYRHFLLVVLQNLPCARKVVFQINFNCTHLQLVELNPFWIIDHTPFKLLAPLRSQADVLDQIVKFSKHPIFLSRLLHRNKVTHHFK
jgi:hypothetical protein